MVIDFQDSYYCISATPTFYRNRLWSLIIYSSFLKQATRYNYCWSSCVIGVPTVNVERNFLRKLQFIHAVLLCWKCWTINNFLSYRQFPGDLSNRDKRHKLCAVLRRAPGGHKQIEHTGVCVMWRDRTKQVSGEYGRARRAYWSMRDVEETGPSIRRAWESSAPPEDGRVWFCKGHRHHIPR